MEPELPSRKNCLARLTPQTFGTLKLGNIIFGLGLKPHCIPHNCPLQQPERQQDHPVKLKNVL